MRQKQDEERNSALADLSLRAMTDFPYVHVGTLGYTYYPPSMGLTLHGQLTWQEHNYM